LEAFEITHAFIPLTSRRYQLSKSIFWGTTMYNTTAKLYCRYS